MGTSPEYMDWVVEQISQVEELAVLEEVVGRSVYGEYSLYAGGKAIGLVCHDTVFIAQLPGIEEIMMESGAETGFPFKGAQPHWILDVEDHDLLAVVLPEVWAAKIPPRKRPTHRPGTDFPWAVGASATRALRAAGIDSLMVLTAHSEDAIRGLRGVDPKAIDVLRAALAEEGLDFAES